MIACRVGSTCRPRRSVPALGVVVLIGTLLPYMCHARESALIRFEIADQFDRVHADIDLRGGVLLVVGADRKGSQYQGGWMDALRTLAESRIATDEIQIIEVADLRGVPFFVKGSVKKKFPSDKRQWVLMDWKGVFARAYGFEPEKCNMLLFDRTDRLLYQVAAQEVDGAVLEEILGAIDAHRLKGKGPDRDAAIGTLVFLGSNRSPRPR